MSSLNKILIPFDFSEASVNALEYVVNFVGPDRSIGIMGLYVGAMPITEADSDKLGSDFVKLLDSFNVRLKVAPEFITKTGSVVKTILATQEESGAEEGLTILCAASSASSETAASQIA